MATRKNGQQIAADNIRIVREWVALRDREKDWDDYLAKGKLKRTDIAKECGFARSVLYQNPTIKEEIDALDVRLKWTQAPLNPGQRTAQEEAKAKETDEAITKRFLRAQSSTEQRVKHLEEQNAILRAQLDDMKQKLLKYKHIENHLAESGRMIHP